MTEASLGAPIAPISGADASVSEEALQKNQPAPVSSRVKVKVNDKEEEVEIEKLKADYQKYASADKRWQEAAAMRKQVDSFVKRLQEGENFDDLVTIMGKDKATKWAEQLLLKEIEWAQLPESERKYRQTLSEKERLELQLKQREEQEVSSRREQAQNIASQEINQEISQAMKAFGRKPDPRFVARIAEMMLANLESKGSRLPAAKAIEHVMKDMRSDFQEYFADLPVEELKQLLPKKTLDALRRADVEEIRANDPLKTRRRDPKDDSPKISSKKSMRMSTDSFFNALEKRLGA